MSRDGSIAFGPVQISVRDYDQAQFIEIDPDHGEYAVHPLVSAWSLARTRSSGREKVTTSRMLPAPTLVIERRAEDLGERRIMFGREARRLRITERFLPQAGSRQQTSETVAEGWFVRLPELDRLDGPRPQTGKDRGVLLVASGPSERIMIRHQGLDEWGDPADVVTTVRLSSEMSVPANSSVHFDRIVELSNQPVDPALFEAPHHFRRVETLRLSTSPGLISRWLGAVRRYHHDRSLAVAAQ